MRVDVIIEIGSTSHNPDNRLVGQRAMPGHGNNACTQVMNVNLLIKIYYKKCIDELNSKLCCIYQTIRTVKRAINAIAK